MGPGLLESRVKISIEDKIEGGAKMNIMSMSSKLIKSVSIMSDYVVAIKDLSVDVIGLPFTLAGVKSKITKKKIAKKIKKGREETLEEDQENCTGLLQRCTRSFLSCNRPSPGCWSARVNAFHLIYY